MLKLIPLAIGVMILTVTHTLTIVRGASYTEQDMIVCSRSGNGFSRWHPDGDYIRHIADLSCDGQHTFSPDGHFMVSVEGDVLTTGAELWRYNLNTGSRRLLHTMPQYQTLRLLQWNPAGDAILFTPEIVAAPESGTQWLSITLDGEVSYIVDRTSADQLIAWGADNHLYMTRFYTSLDAGSVIDLIRIDALTGEETVLAEDITQTRLLQNDVLSLQRHDINHVYRITQNGMEPVAALELPDESFRSLFVEPSPQFDYILHDNNATVSTISLPDGQPDEIGTSFEHIPEVWLSDTRLLTGKIGGPDLRILDVSTGEVVHQFNLPAGTTRYTGDEFGGRLEVDRFRPQNYAYITYYPDSNGIYYAARIDDSAQTLTDILSANANITYLGSTHTHAMFNKLDYETGTGYVNFMWSVPHDGGQPVQIRAAHASLEAVVPAASYSLSTRGLQAGGALLTLVSAISIMVFTLRKSKQPTT